MRSLRHTLTEVPRICKPVLIDEFHFRPVPMNSVIRTGEEKKLRKTPKFGYKNRYVYPRDFGKV